MPVEVSTLRLVLEEQHQRAIDLRNFFRDVVVVNVETRRSLEIAKVPQIYIPETLSNSKPMTFDRCNGAGEKLKCKYTSADTTSGELSAGRTRVKWEDDKSKAKSLVMTSRPLWVEYIFTLSISNNNINNHVVINSNEY